MIPDLKEIKKEIDCFRNRRYPDFVLARSPRLSGGEIPAFALHTIDPQVFEAQLRFLVTNGYRTITADEFHSAVTERSAPQERCVLLTMDDGRKSVWTFGYPLLKKYGLRATVFLIPGFVREGDQEEPNLEDCWAGRCSRRDLSQDAVKGNPLFSWPQAEAMYRSGVIDFQSHTLYHHPVFTGQRILDFYHPGNRMMRYSLPLPMGYESQLKNASDDSLYGMPIYQNSPPMLGQPRFLDDERLTNRCLVHVRESGGGQFFHRPSWRKELQAVVAKWRAEERDCGRFQSQQELEEALLADLKTSRAIIEQRLPGQKVRHLCYPYGVGSPLSVRLSQEAGYVSNFWSVRADRRTNRPGDDPFFCCRLKDDYIYRLPGRGRKSLLAILRAKAHRRLDGALDYGALQRPTTHGPDAC